MWCGTAGSRFAWQTHGLRVRRDCSAMPVYERLVRRHSRDAAGNDLLDMLHVPVQVLVAHPIDRRMIRGRHDPLPEHDLHPAGLSNISVPLGKKQTLLRQKTLDP